MCFCIKSSGGARVALVGCGVLCTSPTPPPAHNGGLFCWPFWGGGPGIGLAFCCFVVYSTRRFVLRLALCFFVIVFFSPFSIAITSLGEERELILVLFVRLFNLRLFGFVCCLFLLVSGKGCGL